MEEEAKKTQFDKHAANPLPSHLKMDIPIKLNTAAILREGQFYRKKQEETIKYFDSLEAGAKDTGEFIEWQNAMRQKDLDDNLASIERRHIEGLISREEAIMARQNLIKKNRQKVETIKEETKQMFEKYLEAKFAQEREMRQLVEDVMDSRANSQDARKRLTEYKAKIVQEVREESRELMRIALEEAEVEMRKKMEIIKQIRAMEAVPAVRYKFVDITSTAGHGLLSEMSIAELRERLALLREAEVRAEDERRDEIQATKLAKELLLMETLETISKHRSEKSRAAAIRLEDKKVKHNVKKPVQDEALTELQRKYEERKAERLREQEVTKNLVTKNLKNKNSAFLSDKKAREERRWEELERSKERVSKLVSQGHYGNETPSGIGRMKMMST